MTPPKRRSLFDDPREARGPDGSFPAPRVPTCPDCGRSDVRKASIIWEAGTTTTTTRGTAVGAVGDDLAVGGIASSSTHRTMLAERVGPPAKPSAEAIGFVVVGGVLGVAVAFGVQAWLAVPIVWVVLPILCVAGIGAMVWTIRRHVDRLSEWKAAVFTWRERGWVCGICGKLFLAR